MIDFIERHGDLVCESHIEAMGRLAAGTWCVGWHGSDVDAMEWIHNPPGGDPSLCRTARTREIIHPEIFIARVSEGNNVWRSWGWASVFHGEEKIIMPEAETDDPQEVIRILYLAIKMAMGMNHVGA